MALYDVTPKPSVEKDLRALPKSDIARVMETIDAKRFPHRLDEQQA